MCIVSSLLKQRCIEKVVLRVQGLKASLLGAIPYSAVRLGSYDGLKWAYKKVRTTSCPPILWALVDTLTRLRLAMSCCTSALHGVWLRMLCLWHGSTILGQHDLKLVMLFQNTGKDSVPPHMTMIFGAIAAVASSSASFPLEIVRRRAMMGTLPAGIGLQPVSAPLFASQYPVSACSLKHLLTFATPWLIALQ